MTMDPLQDQKSLRPYRCLEGHERYVTDTEAAHGVFCKEMDRGEICGGQMQPFVNVVED